MAPNLLEASKDKLIQTQTHTHMHKMESKLDESKHVNGGYNMQFEIVEIALDRTCVRYKCQRTPNGTN